MKLWRGEPDNRKWKPTTRDIGRFWLGLAALFFSLALVSWATPSTSSFTGRWGWLRIFFETFGPRGDVILFGGVAAACLIAGLIKHRADE